MSAPPPPPWVPFAPPATTLWPLMALLLVATSARAEEPTEAPDESTALEPAPDGATANEEPTADERDAPPPAEPEADEPDEGALTAGDDAGAESDLAVPSALPTLEEDLETLLAEGPDDTPLANPFGGVDLIAYGRLRLEGDLGRGDVADDPGVGVALTGRLGAELPIASHRVRIVLGDGRRFGVESSATPTPFTDPAALGFLYALSMTLDVPVLGVPGTLRVGRQSVTVADGRLVGDAPFDPRGRPLDGALYSLGSELVNLRAGAFYLGPFSADDLAEWSALGMLEARWSASFTRGSAYLLEHRDGTLAALGTEALNITTVGGRAELFGFGALGWVGLDGQVPLRASAPTAPPGFGVHGEAGVRYAPELTVFETRGAPVVGIEVEATGGTAAAGRTFRAPAPNPHAFLGTLDLVGTDNVASAMAHAGLEAKNVTLDLAARVVGLTDPKGPLVDAGGARVLPSDPLRTDRYAFTELDGTVNIRPAPGLSLFLVYGVAFPGAALGDRALIHRLWTGVSWTVDPTPEG